MKFVNLTPHKIVYDDGIKREEFEPSGEVLRLEYKEVINSGLPSIVKIGDFTVTNYENANELEITKDCDYELSRYYSRSMIQKICYIVSNPVAKYMKSQRFIAPDTNPASAIRDNAGNIIAVKGFCSYV